MEKGKRISKKGSKNFFSKRLIISLAVLVLISISIIFIAKISAPKILSASLYPEKVMPGQILVVKAEVKDNLLIKEVKAVIETDAEPDTIKLVLDDGSKRQGTYERGWIVHDTSDNQGYTVTVTATNIFGKSISMIVPYQDPTQSHNASEIVGGTFTGNYSFEGGNINIGGNLTVNKALIVNSTILLYPESNPTNATGYAKFYYKAGDIDSYTKLMLHMDGSSGGTTFTDATGKTVTNAASYDSYTKLMLHMEGADGATSYTAETGQTVTFAGTAQLDTAQKKFGTASLLLDGNSDYVSVPDSADWNFGTGDFTVDFWVRFASTAGIQSLISQLRIADLYSAFEIYCYGPAWNSVYVYLNNALPLGTPSWTPSVDTWYHMAVVRAGTDVNLYIDGVSIASGTSSADITVGDTALGVGASMTSPASLFVNGWMDEVRINKGIARWTSNFAPPGSAYGNVSYNTTGMKFGTATAEFHGSGDYLSLADSDDWNFGTGDFTIDTWVKFNTVTEAYRRVVTQSTDADSWIEFGFVADRLAMQFYTAGVATGYFYTDVLSWNTNQWYHLTWERNGNTPLLFIDGVSQSVETSTAFGTLPDCTGTLNIGVNRDKNNYYLDGWIDEVRVSKGIARWTSTFTPPTSAYSTGGLLFQYQNGTIKTLAGE